VSGWQLLGAVALGAIAAAVGTPAGVSGGLLLLPLLLTVFGLNGTVASATNLVFNIVSTPVGIARQALRGLIDRRLTLLLAASAAPAAVLGAMVNVFLLGDSPVFRVMVAGLLGCVAASLLMPRVRPAKVADELNARTRASLIVVGVASGMLGGFYGLGGAVLAAPAALILTGWPVARVSGAALITTLTVSVTGLITYASLDVAGRTTVQTPNWPLGLALGAGGLVGGYLGLRFAGWLSDRLLRHALAIMVILGAVRLVAF
jgi:uncharacterized membrane protein YfcA